MSEHHLDLRINRGWWGLRRVTLRVVIVLLAGCAVPEPKPPQVNLGGYSGAFKQGYAEGCESAGTRSQRRNEGRYKTEADYMMGWNDGFSACRRSR